MSILQSSETQPGLTPFVLVTQGLSPTAPFEPTATLPPGPVRTCPRMSALPTLIESTRPELVATSPLSFVRVGVYTPPMPLQLGSVESKLSGEMLLPFRSIRYFASMAYCMGDWRPQLTRTFRFEVTSPGV